MKGTMGPIAALLISVAMLNMGNGLQGTLVPVRAGIEAFSTLEIGLLGSAYFLGFAMGCLLGPHIVRRVGHIRVFITMSAMASAVPLALSLLVVPVMWWVMRAVLGICFAVLYVVIESWLNERATNETRGTILSIYTVINLVVITIGQLMLTLSDPAGFQLFIVASILVSLAALPVGMTTSAAPAPIEAVKVRVLRLYRLSPVGFAGCLTVGLANGSFWSLGPYYADRIGLDVAGIAFFMSLTVIGGAIGQWPIGKLSDRVDRRRVIVGICLLSGAAGMLMSLFAGETPRLAYGFTALFGLCAFPLYAVAVAHMNDFVAKDEFVEASSGLLLVYGAGAVVGPVLTSMVIDTVGARGLYVATTVVFLSMAGFAMWRMKRRDRPAAYERTRFTEALQSAQTMSPTFDIEVARFHPEPAASPEAGEAHAPRSTQRDGV